MSRPDYDLCVIGGGINGAGIARDAAGRGLSVLLVEAGDLASATSSASTKLIHGGLRYLEHYEFKLVRESLREREILLRIAPHIVRPLEFVLPHDETQRPAWLIRLGLFLYDHLAGHKHLKPSHGISFDDDVYGAPLQKKFTKGFLYSDCWVDDARLVTLNAVDARERGADISTYTACTSLACDGQVWQVGLHDMLGGRNMSIKAAMVVNAAGPWVRGLLEASGLDAPDVPKIRLVKGSHIIVPRKFDGEHAYILQQPDKRIVFAIPYEKNYTLIGTTDVDYGGDPSQAAISPEEVDYLCNAYNNAFDYKITAENVVWTYSGVRPLFDDGTGNASEVTRDYKIFAHRNVGAPLVSVFGGKLTTYRKLGEEVVDLLCQTSGRGGSGWTQGHNLPGGDVPDNDFNLFLEQQEFKYPWISHTVLNRFARAYGTRMDVILHGMQSVGDLGKDLGGHIYECEIFYLVRHEFARTVEDVLWRRTKLGLRATPEAVRNIEWLLSSILRQMGQVHE